MQAPLVFKTLDFEFVPSYRDSGNTHQCRFAGKENLMIPNLTDGSLK